MVGCAEILCASFYMLALLVYCRTETQVQSVSENRQYSSKITANLPKGWWIVDVTSRNSHTIIQLSKILIDDDVFGVSRREF